MPAAWRRWGWQGLASSLHGSSRENGLLFFYDPVPAPPPRLAPPCSLDGNTWNEPFYRARGFPSASPLQTPGCSLRLLQGSSATSTPGLRMVATHGEAGLPHACERKHLRPRECRSWIGPHLDLAPGTGAPVPAAPGGDPGAECPWPLEAFWLTTAQDQCETQKDPRRGKQKVKPTSKRISSKIPSDSTDMSLPCHAAASHVCAGLYTDRRQTRHYLLRSPCLD